MYSMAWQCCGVCIWQQWCRQYIYIYYMLATSAPKNGLLTNCRQVAVATCVPALALEHESWPFHVNPSSRYYNLVVVWICLCVSLYTKHVYFSSMHARRSTIIEIIHYSEMLGTPLQLAIDWSQHHHHHQSQWRRWRCHLRFARLARTKQTMGTPRATSCTGSREIGSFIARNMHVSRDRRDEPQQWWMAYDHTTHKSIYTYPN